MDLGLAGRVGLIAGDGGEIGAATARLLRREGADVVERGSDQIGEHGDVDFLVNLAGALDAGPDAHADDPRARFELGVMGPMRSMKALAPALAERGRGRIVNVVSSADPVTGAAALSLSRLFADRYAKRGVLVNAVCAARAADPEAVAREVVFLCSERASHVTGATWPVGTAAVGVID